jgi:hypothetical protein
MADFLTRSDVENYGPDLVDLVQRGAAHALGPVLEQIQEDNAQLRQRLAREARFRLDQQVERALPDFRDRDRDPRWHRWLLGIDNLSGCVRQQLLNDAIASGDANRVTAFFRGFERESGGSHAASAAPGRTRSSGNKPIYTRSQIRDLYSAHQKGLWAGREAHDIIAAGREGRIVGGTDFAGK